MDGAGIRPPCVAKATRSFTKECRSLCMLGLNGKQRKNDKYCSYKGKVDKVADNLLNRDFYTAKLFEKLTTDATQFKVCIEKIYLPLVMNQFNRGIISYSISLSSNLEQVREM